jgi:hypothetical protein
VLCYVDDILAISHAPKFIMDGLSSMYTLKPDSVKEPHAYLGAEVKKWTIDGAEDLQKTWWAILSALYVKGAIAEVECELTEDIGRSLIPCHYSMIVM